MFRNCRGKSRLILQQDNLTGREIGQKENRWRPGEKGGPGKTQSVILLKRKDANELLKGRESWREFAACAVIGGSDSTANLYGAD